MNPGDVIDIDGEHIRHRPGASALARTDVDDAWRIAFDPTAPVPPLRDGDDVRLEPHPLPDLLMYYLLRKAEGSELAAKHEVDHQLQLLRAGSPRCA